MNNQAVNSINGADIRRIPQYPLAALIIATALLAGGCADSFSTRYERIDADRVRPLAMVFEPAEAAPGDTVKVKAWWAGRPVTSVWWGMSFNYVFNILGVDTAIDTFSLLSSAWAVAGSDTLVPAADSAGITYATAAFVIPPDIIRDNITVSGQMLAALPQEFTAAVPQELAADPALIADMAELTALMYTINIDSLLLLDSVTLEDVGLDSSLTASLAAFAGSLTGAAADPRSLLMLLKQVRDQEDTRRQAAKLAQMLTVRIKILVRANEIYKGESYFSVRYTSAMRYNPYAFPNTNPAVDWIGVYRVKNPNLQFFYPGSRTDYDTLFYLYRREWADTIAGDSVELLPGGYSYFLAAHINPLSRDTAMTLNDTVGVEEHFFDWMYRIDDPLPGVHPDSLMVINNIGADSTVRLYPPVDRRMRHFTVMLTVYDWYIGERLRPRGFAFQSVQGVFAFRQ